MGTVSKNILFYSNYCQHSKEVLGLLTKKNMTDQFTFVCVDNTTLKLPNFVQSVPLICTTNREILGDTDVFNYLNQFQEQTTDIEPFALFCSTNSISDKYSFIGEGGTDVASTSSLEDGSHAFVYVNHSDQKINCPKESEGDTKFDQKSFEAYMAQRDNIQVPPRV
jgi:hypothetical protein